MGNVRDALRELDSLNEDTLHGKDIVKTEDGIVFHQCATVKDNQHFYIIEVPDDEDPEELVTFSWFWAEEDAMNMPEAQLNNSELMKKFYEEVDKYKAEQREKGEEKKDTPIYHWIKHEDIWYDEEGFCLYQSADLTDYHYEVVTPDGEVIGRFNSKLNGYEMTHMQLFDSGLLKKFDKAVSDFKEKHPKMKFSQLFDDDKTDNKNKKDYFDDSWFEYDDNLDGWRGNYNFSGYQQKAKSTGFLEVLNKSDTLVIHPDDRTTDMLSQVYDGRGFDVLRDGNIDKDELHQLIESHDKIICLGHGCSSGLINKQGYGFTIGAEEGPMLAKKKTFVCWCYASDFGRKYGCHGLWTGNLPSEVEELKWVNINDKEYTREYVLENITYWSKLLADVLDMAWENPQGAVDYVRKHYLEKYDDGMTRYNAEHTECI